MPDTWTIDPGPAQVVIATDPTAGQLTLTKVTAPPPEPKVTFAASEEGGDATVREYNNREVTLTVFLAEGTQAAVDNQQTALLERIAKLQREGGILQWKHASLGPVQFDVVTASTAAGEHDLTYVLANALPIELKFTCRPFARGTERLLAQGTLLSTARFLELTGITVPGDVPALARLELSGASVAQSSLLYAIDQPDAATTTTGVRVPVRDLLWPLGGIELYASGSIGGQAVVEGPAPTGAVAGSWSPVAYLRKSSGGRPIALTGEFRVFCRFYRHASEVSPVTLRLRWTAGVRESGLTENAAWATSTPGWSLADLGVVAVDGGSLDGVLERQAPGSQYIYADSLLFVPIARFGAAYASAQTTPGALLAADSGSGSGNVTSSAAQVGGTWTATGSTPDFIRGALTRGRATRSATSATSRALTLPLASPSVEATCRFIVGAGAGGDGYTRERLCGLVIGNAAGVAALSAGTVGAAGAWGVAAFYSDTAGGGVGRITTVEGAQAPVERASVSTGTTTVPDVRLAFSAGAITARITYQVVTAAIDTAAPSSGLMVGLFSTGKDAASPVSFYNFQVTGATPPDRVLHPGKTATITSAATTRVNADGLSGPVAAFECDRPYLPPSGRAGRSVRVVLGTSRGDYRIGADAVPGDTFTGRVYATPRYLQIPDANA